MIILEHIIFVFSEYNPLWQQSLSAAERKIAAISQSYAAPHAVAEHRAGVESHLGGNREAFDPL